MLRCLILVLALLLLPVATQAASFDCKKATSRIEKVICGDPELSRLDEAMAAAYAKALTAWDGKIAASVRVNQRGWVASRGLIAPGMDQGGIYCTDDASRLPCLRGVYRDRIAVLSDPAWRLGGIYTGGKDDVLRIRVVPGGLEFAYQLSGPDYPQGSTPEGAPIKVAAGATRVVFPLTGAGRDACRLTGDFTAEAVILAQQGPCGGQALSGRWTRDQTRDPEAEMF
jgi:hypothetical protein